MSGEDLLKNLSVRTIVKMGMLLHNLLPPLKLGGLRKQERKKEKIEKQRN
jgi:hypothetical protein